MKILHLKFVILLEYQTIKFFLQVSVPNWSEEYFVIKKSKNTVPWTYTIRDLKCEEIVRTFYEKLKIAKNKSKRV